MGKSLSKYIKDLEGKDEEITFLKEENERLKKENSRLKLDAVKELRKQLPEIEETFKNWLHFDGKDLYEEACEE